MTAVSSLFDEIEPIDIAKSCDVEETSLTVYRISEDDLISAAVRYYGFCNRSSRSRIHRIQRKQSRRMDQDLQRLRFLLQAYCSLYCCVTLTLCSTSAACLVLRFCAFEENLKELVWLTRDMFPVCISFTIFPFTL
ncbi:uncharacterized protein LOC110897356 [Helianthus annuus]|uniref:uncharacterized protein LOC110897356 n=1 Tax=Helianthus annuus TaxID=4232 RepID=UPI000B8EF435|nr:uncharacterized protein LOC110897356 [Helianthus annuus]